jgi:hypothetical protein
VIGPNLTSAAAGASYATAKVKQGIDFPNVSGKHFLGALTSTSVANFSVSPWFYWRGTATTNLILFQNGLGGSNGYGVIIANGAGGSGNKIGVILNGLDWDAFNAQAVMPTGAWTHIAVTKGGGAGTWILYLNGIAVASGSGTPNVPTATTYIGTGAVHGVLDEIALWNSLLTAAEVRAVYERQAPKYSGTFTSRIMNAQAAAQSWTTLNWRSLLPFHKELPDAACSPAPCAHANDESADDYPSLVGSTGTVGDNDLVGTNLQALWHLNEAAGTTGAGSVADDSGQGKTITPNAVTFGSVGRFGTAGSLNGTTSWLNAGDVLNPESASYTASVWFRRNAYAAPAAGQVIFSKGSSTSLTEGWAIHLGTNGKLYMRVNASGDATQTAGMVSTRTFLDNDWHHAVLVIDRTANVIRTYVDGTSNGWVTGGGGPASASIAGFGAISTTDTLALGAARAGAVTSSYFAGVVDEAAIWDRALTTAEIVQLYRRGANRARFQVRICTAADCSDDASGANWKGPDGTKSTYFSELNNNTVPLTSTGDVKKTPPALPFASFTNPIGTSQYFQYRVVLESDDAETLCDYGSGAVNCSPELRSVSVDPAHYHSSSPSIVSMTGVAYTSLSAFTQTLGASCAGGIGYNLGVGSSSAAATWYYWDATKAADCVAAGMGAWCAADGTAAKSTSASVISANLSTFAAAAGTGTVYFKAYLSSSGATACELDQLVLDGS